MAKSNSIKRVAIYARVSTDNQTVENQLRELRQVADRSGWEIVHEYIDNGVSGAKGRAHRPQFDALLKAATRREFDLVAAWSVDRLGRSLRDLVNFLEEIHGAGVDLFLHQQGLDTSTASGRAMFGMLSVFSEFERSMIRERVMAGLERAKANGKQLGRPKISITVERKVVRAHKDGEGMLSIANRLGIGSGTVQRVVREFKAQGGRQATSH